MGSQFSPHRRHARLGGAFAALVCQPALNMPPSAQLARRETSAEDKWLRMKFWSSQVHNKEFDDLMAERLLPVEALKEIVFDCSSNIFMQFRRVVEPNSLQRIGFGVVASNLS